MVFTDDTEVALAAVADLVNAELGGLAELDAFWTRWGWTGRRDRTDAELRAVLALRPRLRGLWESGEDELVGTVNALLREFGALPQLIRHDGSPYHLHAVSRDAPWATRMAVEAAMAFVDVIRSGETSRLRICARPGCGNVVVDLSKNRSKRFCDTGCGNRAAVTAYRARKAAGAGRTGRA